MGARDAFFPGGASHFTKGQFNPVALGELLIGRTPAGFYRKLKQVRVYTGRPDATRHSRNHTAHMNQCAAWESAGTCVVWKPLRYPPDFPASRPQEKGVDVQLAIDLVTHSIAGTSTSQSSYQPTLTFVRLSSGSHGERIRPLELSWRPGQAPQAIAKSMWTPHGESGVTGLTKMTTSRSATRRTTRAFDGRSRLADAPIAQAQVCFLDSASRYVSALAACRPSADQPALSSTRPAYLPSWRSAPFRRIPQR